MDHVTPAVDIGLKDLAANRRALTNLLKNVLPPIKTVLDVRYGLGGWAKVVSDTYRLDWYYGFEYDERTANEAWKDNLAITLINASFPEGIPTRVKRRLIDPVDLILADFNTSTSLKREPLDELLAVSSGKYLIFTDVACGKLHINYKAYGLRRPDLDDYWKRFSVPGYKLVDYSKQHHAASTALYQRVG